MIYNDIDFVVISASCPFTPVKLLIIIAIVLFHVITITRIIYYVEWKLNIYYNNYTTVIYNQNMYR
jgi:hypothetical protein